MCVCLIVTGHTEIFQGCYQGCVGYYMGVTRVSQGCYTIEQTDLCHQDDKGHTPDIGAFPAHIRASDHHKAADKEDSLTLTRYLVSVTRGEGKRGEGREGEGDREGGVTGSRPSTCPYHSEQKCHCSPNDCDAHIRIEICARAALSSNIDGKKVVFA